MLAFGGTVADFTAAVEADCPLQRMMSFAFVEPDLGTPLEFASRIQSIMNRVRSTRPTSAGLSRARSAADRRRVSAESGLARRSRSNGGGDAQDVGPIALDRLG